MPTPLRIGWKEWIDFPDWGLSHVKAKADTGARTSALDVAHYEVREDDHGGRVIALHLALYRRKPERRTVVTVPVIGEVRVRNTGGGAELRLLIETAVRVGPVVKRIHLTVSNRARMICPVILGRQALADDFVVDAGRKYLLKA